MHMADALVVPAVAGTMYVASAAAAGYSGHRLHLENDNKKIPVMGVMGAFVFAAQMINFTIPGTGSSGHLCGGMLLSAILGPFAGFLSMIGVLLIQCLLFADGGILALGCNIWNMAFYGCFLGALLIWRPIVKNGINKRKIFLASILGCVLSLQLGAFSVVLETLISGISELPFQVFLLAMQPIHLAIGLVEGLITAVVLSFVYETRPELLWGVDATVREKKLSNGAFLGILGGVAVLVAGVLSLFASSLPDGLEWSIERLTGSTELEAGGGIYDTLARAQEKMAILPDYAFRGSEAASGTSVSGIVGTVIVLALLIVIGVIFKATRKRTDQSEE